MAAAENIQVFDPTLLDGTGLNRYAIFNIDNLPADIAASVRASCRTAQPGRQLVLLGHAGRALWDSIKASGIVSDNPIDDFTVQTVQHWFSRCHPSNTYEILYPGTRSIGLQRLGELAGWHHPTPFMVGIDREWGTWFAYRAVVVTDTAFTPTQTLHSASPCDACLHKMCISSCPAAALEGGKFDLGKCVTYRKRADSLCKATCLARVSCPVGSEHRYSDEQICHCYGFSMRAIEQYYG